MSAAWNVAWMVGAGLSCVWLVGFLAFRGPESVRIVVLAMLAAVVYGVVHDQITARISIEYFTIGHPRLFASDDPSLHGLAWGVIATWWVGLLLGIPLALAARRGERPKVAARELVRPILLLLGVMALCALVAAAFGCAGARVGWFRLYGELAQAVPEERHVAFLTAGWSHAASYLAGFAGGVLLIRRTWKRRALRVQTAAPTAS